MKCNNCGKKLEKDFNYCPKCGIRVNRGIFSVFQSLFNRKMVNNQSKFMSDFPKMKGGITIKVTGPKGTKVRRIPMKGRIPVKKQTRSKKVPVRKRPTHSIKKPSTPPKKLVEPESTLERDGKKFILKFKLPDIKKADDIDIMKFSESLEMRARIKDKMYFKLIKLPGKLKITDKKFSNGVLTVEMTK